MDEDNRQLLEKIPSAVKEAAPQVVSFWGESFKKARRIIVAVVGTTVILIGIALIVLPGPAFIVIPIGLAILGTEFAWARRWLKKGRDVANNLVSRKKES